MASKIADAFVAIGARTAKFEKGMSGVRKRLSRTGENFKKLAKVATVSFLAIGAAATFMGKKALDAASSFENLEVRLKTFLGSQEKATQAMKFFSEQAEKVPFSLEQVAEAGTTLTAMGADFRKWLPVATDVAAVMGVDLVTAASQLGRAFSGGAGAADVFREKGILNIIKESKGIKDLSKLTLPEFREAMFDAFVDPQGKIAGAAKGLSKTWTGQLSMVGDAIFKLKKDLGEAFLPAMKELVTFTIKPLIVEWGDWVKANKRWISLRMEMVIKGLGSAIRGMGKGISFVLKRMREFERMFILTSINMRRNWILFTEIVQITWEALTGEVAKGFLFIQQKALEVTARIKKAFLELQGGFSDIVGEALIPFSKKWSDAFLQSASQIVGASRKIKTEFIDLSKEQDKTTAKNIAAIQRETAKRLKFIKDARENFLDSLKDQTKEEQKERNAAFKSASSLQEKLTKKINDENKKRSASFVSLEDVFKKIQERALGIEKAPDVNIKAADREFANASKKEIEEVKRLRAELKKINKTLLTRDFVPAAS